jgi:hypothetical protein
MVSGISPGVSLTRELELPKLYKISFKHNCPDFSNFIVAEINNNKFLSLFRIKSEITD